MNLLTGDGHFMNHLSRASRPNILQLVYITTKQNFALFPTHKVATLLTRIILWMCLLRPIPIKRESVLGSSTGTAV